MLKIAKLYHVAALGVCAVFFSLYGNEAKSLEIEPSVTLSELETDNIDLTPEGESERVTQIIPQISINHTSQKSSLNAKYGLQILRYQNDSAEDDQLENYDLDARFDANNGFILSSHLNKFRQAINSADQIADDNVTTQQQDRTDISTFMIKPEYKYQIGAQADMQLSYVHTEIDYSEDIEGVNDENDIYLLQFNSGPAFQNISWLVSFKRTQFASESAADDDTYDYTNLSIRHNITRRVAWLLRLGYEDIDVTSTTFSKSESTWSVGVNWSPSRRTRLELEVGERSFGKTGTLSLIGQQNRNNWRLSYSEDIVDVAGLYVQNESTSAIVGGGDDSLSDIELTSLPSVDAATFLRKRIVARYNWDTRRFSFSIGGYNEKRSFEDVDDVSEEVDQADASISIKFGRKLRLQLRSEIRDIKNKVLLAEEKQDDTLKSNSVSINYDVKKNSVLSVQYKSNTRDSIDEEDEYEQRITEARISFRF